MPPVSSHFLSEVLPLQDNSPSDLPLELLDREGSRTYPNNSSFLSREGRRPTRGVRGDTSILCEEYDTVLEFFGFPAGEDCCKEMKLLLLLEVGVENVIMDLLCGLADSIEDFEGG